MTLRGRAEILANVLDYPSPFIERVKACESAIRQAVAAEREAILKIIDLRSTMFGGEQLSENESAIVQNIIAAIRARSNADAT